MIVPRLASSGGWLPLESDGKVLFVNISLPPLLPSGIPGLVSTGCGREGGLLSGMPVGGGFSGFIYLPDRKEK